MNSEEALRLLGPYSKWQIRTYMVYAFGFGVPLAWMWMSIVFIGDDPGHRCALPPNSSYSVNESIPQTCDKDGNCEYEKCVMYRDPAVQNETIPCTNGYWYDPSAGYESTLVTDFDLVCSRGTLVEMSMALNQIGQALGTFIFTTLSDRYGRKIVFLGCLWTNIVIATVQAFSVNMLMFTVLSFIDGLQQQGMLAAAGILAMEIFPMEQRTFAGVAIEFTWALGYISTLPFVYFIRNWRYLQLAITLPLLFTISFYWLISESIPWLVANDKTKKAEEILRRAANVNGIELPVHIFKDEYTMEPLLEENETKHETTNRNGKDEEQSKHGSEIKGFKEILSKLQNVTTKEPEKIEETEIPRYTPFDILKSKTLLLYSLVMSLNWFVAAIAYNAMALTVTYLPGNRYVNFALYAIMEVPAYIVIWIMLLKLGRRISVSLCNLIGGIAVLMTIVSSLDVSFDATWLSVILSVTGKSAFTMSYAAIYVHMPELFPTNIRTYGLGIGQFWAKIAGMIAPYFRVLVRTMPWLAPAIIGTLALISSALTLILPETRNEPLPHSIEQVEKFKRKL